MRLWLCAGAANGFIAVAMGALAAHSLSGANWETARQWIHVGADYQMSHALALLGVAVLSGRAAGAARRWVQVAGWSFLAGTVLFSGVLFVMGLAGLTGLGVIVPAGGLAYMIGWAALFCAGLCHVTGTSRAPEPADPGHGGDKDGRNG